MIDWNLGIIPYGLAVEGDIDKFVIEKFMDLRWKSWRSQVKVMDVGGKSKVYSELQQNKQHIWGLVDRDALSQKQIDDLITRYPNLLILPRWTIENYFIDPDELIHLIPQNDNESNMRTIIDKHKSDWLKRGALWHVFVERGLIGDNYPNPRSLIKSPMPDKQEIRQQLTLWTNQFNPDAVLDEYDHLVSQFNQQTKDNYRLHIYGKKFFSEVIVQKALNLSKQQDSNVWRNILLKNFVDCPQDIVPLLTRILG